MKIFFKKLPEKLLNASYKLKLLPLAFVLSVFFLHQKTYGGLFIFELQGINADLNQPSIIGKYRNLSYYSETVPNSSQEIVLFYGSFFGRYCIFGPCSSYITHDRTFSTNARAIISFNLLKDAIAYYGGNLKNFEIPSYIITEFFQEAVQSLGDKIKERAIVDVLIQGVSIIKETGTDEKCKFNYVAKANITLLIGIWMGKTFYAQVNFQIPITVDILSWLPPVRAPGGERALHTGTIVINFGICDTYIEHDISSYDMLQYSKVPQEEFFERIKKITSYIIYRYLGRIDYQPLTFLILQDFSVYVSKIYITTLITTNGEEDAIALEFSGKGGDVMESQLQIIQSPYRIINSEKIKIRVRGSNNTKAISYRLDWGAWSMWVTPVENEPPEFELEVANLPQGLHRIEIVGLTYTGNINEVPQVIDFFVDRSPPDGEVFVKKYSRALSIKAQAKDNSGEEIFLKIRVKDQTNEIYTAEKKFKDKIDFQENKLSEGTYKVLFWLEDKAGNSTEVKETEVIIDRTPPQVKPTLLPPEKARFENLKLVVSLKDNIFPYGELTYFIEEIVSEGRKTCFSQWGTTQSLEIKEPFGVVNIQGAENGKKYHLCFKVADPAGNESQIFESEFIVDTTPPQIEIIDFPRRVTFERNIRLVISASDNATPPEKIKLFWDLNSKEAIKNVIRRGGNLSIFLENVEDGRYKLVAYAMDEAGNVSQFLESDFIVDTTLLKLGGGVGTIVKCSSFDIRYPLIFVLLYSFFIRFIFPYKKNKKESKS